MPTTRPRRTVDARPLKDSAAEVEVAIVVMEGRTFPGEVAP